MPCLARPLAPYCSFFPLLATPAVWRLSYDILCLCALGKLLTSGMRRPDWTKGGRARESERRSRVSSSSSSSVRTRERRHESGTPGRRKCSPHGEGSTCRPCPGHPWRLSVVALSVGVWGTGWDAMTHSDVLLCLSLSITVKCPTTWFGLHVFLYLFTLQRI